MIQHQIVNCFLNSIILFEKTNYSNSISVTADQILEELADESIIDLRSHWPISPLLDIGLFNIPPQPKKVQDWTMMESKFNLKMFE